MLVELERPTLVEVVALALRLKTTEAGLPLVVLVALVSSSSVMQEGKEVVA